MRPTGGDEPAPARLHRWSTALDDLEASLDAAAGAATTAVPSPWVAPTGLGPLPDALRERAAALLGRLRDLEGDLRAQLGAVDADLAEHRSRRRAPAAAPAAALVDRFA